MQLHPCWRGSALFVTLALAGAAAAESAPPASLVLPAGVDSGWVRNSAARPEVIFSSVVEAPGAPWMRLRFALAELGDAPPGAAPGGLRLTALLDGAVQELDRTALQQWANHSAYFNGDRVLVEIVADPAASPSRVIVDQLVAGVPVDGGVAALCGDDDRIPSDDSRIGRLMPTGCTAWIIDDTNHCMLSAGHCSFPAGSVVEFNVPLSDAEGNVQHPLPQDQYPVDPLSVQSAYIGVGNDWAYFGCFANSQTDLTAFEAQGAHIALAAAPPPVQGQTIVITGFGADDSPLEWDQIQQTHAGPYVSASGTAVQYAVDTRGGNSGSPVIDQSTGLAIAIHTNGGCTSSGGSNRGTALHLAPLQDALANPLGVCRPSPPVAFEFPGGLPDPLHPAGALVRVHALPTSTGAPQPGTGMLHWDAGAGPNAVPMIEVAPNVYDAPMPSLECAIAIEYYFSAQSTGGETATDPRDAPQAVHATVSGAAYDYTFGDDFENDLGWSVQNTPGLTGGAWERGAPAGGGDRGDPPGDGDGSGLCYTTGLADGNNDVDGGTTTLTSPMMDASARESHITYRRWFSNTNGGSPGEDVLLVEVTDDGGASWTTLEVVGPSGPESTGGWFAASYRVADYVAPGTQFRIRFVAGDTGSPSIVEAAIDGVRLNRSASGVLCERCAGDVDGDGTVSVDDLVAVIVAWGPCPAPCAADVIQDGSVNVDDLVAVIIAWGDC